MCLKGLLLLTSLKKNSEPRAYFPCIRARRATGNADSITAGHVISDRKGWHSWLVSAGGPHTHWPSMLRNRRTALLLLHSVLQMGLLKKTEQRLTPVCTLLYFFPSDLRTFPMPRESLSLPSASSCRLRKELMAVIAGAAYQHPAGTTCRFLPTTQVRAAKPACLFIYLR